VKKRTAILVDDERLARRELSHLLAAHPALSVVGQAASVDEAAALVNKLDPDVIFLDIQMPKRSGFELLDACDVRGQVVFVTAHDVHAIRAFEVNALDYLLKPVHPDRLAVTVARLTLPAVPLQTSPAAKPNGRPTGPPQGPSAPGAPPTTARLELDDHLFLHHGRAARFVRVRAIVCLRGADDYAEVVLEDGKQLLSPRPLREWEMRLPPRSFVRIHRAAIVNLDHVLRIEPAGDDSFRVFVRGAEEALPMSRRYAARLRSAWL
jgi:two-component system LytT family response regulator